MNQISTEQIQSQFEKLPKDLQLAITSTEVSDSVKAIGQKYGLHIDQIGEMMDTIGMIILGFLPSKEFVKRFSSATEIDLDTATAIANEVNTDIFGKIRSSMQKQEEQAQFEQISQQSKQQSYGNEIQAQKDLATLERAGGFSIEKESTANNVASQSMPTAFIGREVTHSDKERILSSIEDKPNTARPTTNKHETYTEPLVDQLLNGTTARPEEKIGNNTRASNGESTPTNLPTGDESNDNPKFENTEPLTEPLSDQKPAIEISNHVANTDCQSAPAVPKKVTSENKPAQPVQPAVPPKPKGPDAYRELIN